MDYERVLIATDLSAPSGAAAPYAFRLAPRAELHVLHVRAMAPPSIIGSPTPDDTREAREALHGALQEWAKAHRMERAQLHLADGSARREVPRQAEALGADLIVVGATGAGALRGRLLGSTARHVARHASMDVLVARGPMADAWPAHVLVPTDFEPPSAVAVRRAHALLERGPRPARVTLAHVLETDVWRQAASPAARAGADAAKVRDAAAAALGEVGTAELGGRAEKVVRTGHAVEEVAELAADLRVDLCILGTHGGGALERALMGSVAEGVVENAPCSVLVARK